MMKYLEEEILLRGAEEVVCLSSAQQGKYFLADLKFKKKLASVNGYSQKIFVKRRIGKLFLCQNCDDCLL